MNWLQLLSTKRFGGEELHAQRKDDRTEFQRDYDRLIFSAPFRRLQNKTQVFPLPSNIFVHNRLTHSLEVSSVGRSLGNDTARQLMQKHPELADTLLSEIGTIVSAACLAHDLGNPPFGHSGEKAIATFFSEEGGGWIKQALTTEEWADLTHFDGNANAFRLLTHQFNGRRKGGFVLTYTTLASIIKYPYPATLAGKKNKFGFFKDEAEAYHRIATELGIATVTDQEGHEHYVRHPLVYLVEAADDICYQIMDIEDAHKLKIFTTEQTIDLLLGFFPTEKHQRMRQVMDMVADQNEKIVYLRSSVIGLLERECVNVFIEHEDEILAGTFQGALIDHISPLPLTAYKHCSKEAVAHIYHCKDVVDIELAGYRVISTLIELLVDAVTHPDKAYSKLLLARISPQYQIEAPTLYGKVMAVLDYISGMTDIFAFDLYKNIKGIMN